MFELQQNAYDPDPNWMALLSFGILMGGWGVLRLVQTRDLPKTDRKRKSATYATAGGVVITAGALLASR